MKIRSIGANAASWHKQTTKVYLDPGRKWPNATICTTLHLSLGPNLELSTKDDLHISEPEDRG